MITWISITCRTFTMWILAAVVNALLYGICNSIQFHQAEAVGLIFFAGILSLLLSIPAFFIFWLILLLVISKKIYGRALFRAALSTGIVLACSTSFFALKLNGTPARFALSLSIIVSAITSIMMHFNVIRKIGTKSSEILN